MDDRTLLLDAFRAGIAGVEPEIATTRAAERLDFRHAHRVIAIAAGKAALPMARGLAAIVNLADGVIVAPDHGEAPLPLIVGGHPIPNEGSAAGARRSSRTRFVCRSGRCGGVSDLRRCVGAARCTGAGSRTSMT